MQGNQFSIEHSGLAGIHFHVLSALTISLLSKTKHQYPPPGPKHLITDHQSVTRDIKENDLKPQKAT